MNRIQLLAIGTVLTCALTTVAQQAHPGTNHASPDGVPTVAKQLKVLTEALALTGAQQAQVKPILQHLHDATVKFMGDQSLSREDRQAKVEPFFYETDQQIRKILNENQKKKLDQFEQEPHPEMHGDLGGATR